MSELKKAVAELATGNEEISDELPKRERVRIDVMMLVASAAAIDIDELRKAKSELERFDAIGCFVDPTRYIQTANAREGSLKIVNAVLAFRAALEAKS